MLFGKPCYLHTYSNGLLKLESYSSQYLQTILFRVNPITQTKFWSELEDLDNRQSWRLQ